MHNRNMTMAERIRLLTASAVFIICVAVFVLVCGETVKAHAVMRDKTYKFGMSITVSGTVGSAIEEQTCTISINGGASLVRAIPAGMDISSWFMGSTTPRPAGLVVTVAEDAAVGANSLKVKFSGTVYGASQDSIKIVVQNIYFDENESDWYAYANVSLSGDSAKYNIIRNLSVPSGYSAVGNGLYIKNQKSGTAGWVLSGAKYTALTQNNEMQVFVNGSFLVSLSAGADVSGWFTGELYKFNDLSSSTTSSMLPEGVTAKIKERVSVGDSSFTIVFRGTPYKGSSDLIAFRIPDGVVSYSTGSGKGDRQDSCRVTNTTGKYRYDISTDDSTELYTEWIKITYPDAVLEAGKPVTAEDNLIVTYEIIGTVNGVPLTFTDIQINKSTIRGICYQNAANQPPAGQWNDHITTATGLVGTIISISSDRRTIQARLTGIPKKQTSYPYKLGGRGFILNHAFNSAGHLITGYTSGETTLTIVEPTLSHVTISQDITITKEDDSSTVNVSSKIFTISFGDDTLAEDLPEGRVLKLLYRYTRNPQRDYEYNGLEFSLYDEAKAGDHQIRVRIWTNGNDMSTFKGYLQFCFPKEYLTSTKDYGNNSYYDIPFSRIYVDVKKTEREWVSLTEFSINGTYNNEHLGEIKDHEWVDSEGITHHELVQYTEGLILKPIGTGKVQFTVTLDPVISIAYDFEAGDSVKKFVWLEFLDDKDNSPFYFKYDMDYVEKDFQFYDITTTEAISKDNPDPSKPRVLHLEIDLGEFYAMKTFCQDADVIVKARRTDGNWGTEWFRFDRAAHINIRLKGQAGGGSSNIVYNNEDVIIYAKDESGNTVEGTYINLSTEKFTSEMKYKCYSLDGGSSWKEAKSAFTDKQFAALLNKGMTLAIADKYDKKAKGPADDAEIQIFDALNKRPSAPKLKIDYSTCADPTGATTGGWVLTDSSGELLSAEDLAALDIGLANSSGKTVDEKGYGSWPVSGGLTIAPLSGTKVASTVYYVRLKPTADTPASKVAKIKVKGAQKAPKVKVDYRKEIIKLKKDMIIYFGETPDASAQEATGDLKEYSDYAGKYIVVDADMAKTGIDISAYITNERNTILVWSGATKKRAASAVQTIKLAARQSLADQTLKASNGKLKLDKKYEVYNADKDKWGALPKIDDSCELLIRLKATAKGGKETDSSYAASEPATLVITFGEYDRKKGESGITSAQIVAQLQ